MKANRLFAFAALLLAPPAVSLAADAVGNAAKDATRDWESAPAEMKALWQRHKDALKVLDISTEMNRPAVCHDILDFCARVVATVVLHVGHPASWWIQTATLARAAVDSRFQSPFSSSRRWPAKRTLAADNLTHRARWLQFRLGASSSQDSHSCFRFASARAWRAFCRAVSSSSGMRSPVLKYISSGVCPRNAECGRRELCSCT